MECSLSCIRPEAYESAQVPAPRRRLGHHPEGRGDDVQGRGRDPDRRLGRERGALARQGGKAGPDPRGREHARPGRLRIVRESARGCEHAAHPRPAARRRYAHRSLQGDRRRGERAHAQAVRVAEADRSGEADPRESKDGSRRSAEAFRAAARQTRRSAVASPGPGGARFAASPARGRTGQYADHGPPTDGARHETRGAAQPAARRAAQAGHTRTVSSSRNRSAGGAARGSGGSATARSRRIAAASARRLAPTGGQAAGRRRRRQARASASEIGAARASRVHRPLGYAGDGRRDPDGGRRHRRGGARGGACSPASRPSAAAGQAAGALRGARRPGRCGGRRGGPAA